MGDNAISRARQLRRALTPHEARLWPALRALKAQGYHFRRQAPFRGYFLDFVCFRYGLVIELDGGQHAEAGRRSRDAVRDAVLQREGYRTLRFWNQEVAENFDGVLLTILNVLSEGPHPSRLRRATLPTEGEGEGGA